MSRGFYPLKMTVMLPTACRISVARPVRIHPSERQSSHNHFFQRKNRYGKIAAASIMISAIG